MNDERSRRLLEMLGLSPEDLPEPEPPSEEEVHQRVRDLLDIDKAKLAADFLSEWPEQVLPLIRDAFVDSSFLEKACGQSELHGPMHVVVGVFCKKDPAFVVEHIDSLLVLPIRSAEDCVQTAFEHNAKSLAGLLEELITSERNELIIAALVGIRKAAWTHALSVQREDALYQSCLRLCSPTYPAGCAPNYVTESDPALFVCQSFGELAEQDLAVKPFFDIDNSHFMEILRWLPSVVSYATPELVRTEFKRALTNFESSSRIKQIAERLIPLASLKLGEECRSDVEALLSLDALDPHGDMRTAATKALAIITCGRDPLVDASCAHEEGNFDSLSISEQSILLAAVFNGEVLNGHVFQFLFNSSGLRASETCKALERLGDSIGLQLLQTGIAAVMSENIANTPHESVRRLDNARRRELTEPLEDLYAQYCQQDDITLRLYGFVLNNADLF